MVSSVMLASKDSMGVPVSVSCFDSSPLRHAPGLPLRQPQSRAGTVSCNGGPTCTSLRSESRGSGHRAVETQTW